MILAFLPEAQAELYESVIYYQTKEKGLGYRFRDEMIEVFSTILHHPHLWREQAGGYRRVNCPVFPYYIAYFIRGDVIVVAAVAHAARHPDYWKQRSTS